MPSKCSRSSFKTMTQAGKQHFPNRTAARRRCWLTVHRVIGLSAGALLVLIGVTGSLLVFWQDIDAWLNPDLFRVAVPQTEAVAFRPIGEILEAAKQVMPPGGRFSTIYYPHDETTAYQVVVVVPSTPKANTPFELAQYHVFVDPYTAKVTGTRLVRPAGLSGAVPRTFIGFVFALHYALLLPRVGEPLLGDTVVAVIGMILLITLVSGVYLWWPSSGHWRQAWTIKWRAHVRRLNYDVHKTVGMYFLPMLAAVLLSGIYLDWPDVFIASVRVFSQVKQVGEVKSVVIEGKIPISVDHAWSICSQQFPDGKLYSFKVPNHASGVYVFRKHVPLGWGVWGMRQIVIDQYSGEVVHVADPLRGTAGEVFVQWQWPLHSGLVLGLAGRWGIVATGLMCPLLFGTGCYQWWCRRKGIRQKK